MTLPLQSVFPERRRGGEEERRRGGEEERRRGGDTKIKWKERILLCVCVCVCVCVRCSP